MIDSLSERYGMLPSETYERATTFDILVYDVVTSYRLYLENKQNGKAPAISQESLAAMVNKVKG